MSRHYEHTESIYLILKAEIGFFVDSKTGCPLPSHTTPEVLKDGLRNPQRDSSKGKYYKLEMI